MAARWSKVLKLTFFNLMYIKSPNSLALTFKTPYPYIFQIPVVNQLHQQEVVEEQLSLCELHYLLRSHSRAVQNYLFALCDWSWLAWQLQSSIEVWQIVREDQDCIRERQHLPELLKLFG